MLARFKFFNSFFNSESKAHLLSASDSVPCYTERDSTELSTPTRGRSSDGSFSSSHAMEIKELKEEKRMIKLTVIQDKKTDNPESKGEAKLAESKIQESNLTLTPKELKIAREELKKAIDFINKSIKKNRLAKKIIQASLLLVEITSISHLIYTNSTFNRNLTRLGEECGQGYPYSYFNDYGFFAQSTESCLQPIKYAFIPGTSCYDTGGELCSGPGMWEGYVSVIICVGMILPAYISCCLIACGSNYTHWFDCVDPTLRLLNEEEAIFIRKCMESYNIPSGTDLYQLLDAFKKRLTDIENAITGNKTLFPFLLGSKARLTSKETKDFGIVRNAPVYTYFFNDPLFEKGLLQHIAEFADMKTNTNLHTNRTEPDLEKEDCYDASGMDCKYS